MFEKNLKYYRLKNNYSKAELAEACGLTPMAITNYENGVRKPDIEMVTRIADVLGVHVVDFISSRNSNLSFEHGEFRKKSTMTKSQQEYIREYVEEYFSRFYDAIDCLGGNPLPDPIEIHSIKYTGDYNIDALSLRETLQFNASGPIEDLIAQLENKGVLVVDVEVDNDKFSGMNGRVNDYPYIAINASMRVARKRTTIAHELAHIMFDKSIPDSITDIEKYATMVAGAFLLPANDINRELGQRRTAITKDMTLICKEYGVSMYLLVKRASQEKIISLSIEREFYIKANSAGWKNSEPDWTDKYESANLLNQLVYRAINEEGLSIQRGAELLGKPYTEIKEYCGLMEV